MRFLICLLLVAAVICDEMLVTKEYTDYLKRHVNWEVEEYESNIFRGWTMEEAQTLFGLESLDVSEDYPEVEHGVLPESVDWTRSACDHGPQNQAKCGSCWAFAATGMLSSRCCMDASDHGWLSPQELVSCDKGSMGCKGGYLNTPITYFIRHGGLVPDACFPYKAVNTACPTKCVDGSDWTSAHVCKCSSSKACSGTAGISNCLKSGPTVIAFRVCRSFMTYKSGIYKCDCTSYIGGHAVLAMGYGSTPSCHFHVRNSWGTNWGQAGYFDIACGTCLIQGGPICSKVSN